MKKYFFITLAALIFGFTFGTQVFAVSVPSVATGGTNWIFTTSADLQVSVSNLGGAPSVTVGAQYGTTTAYGSTAYGGVMTSTGSVLPRTGLGSLTCGTTYHYRAYATNTAGTAYGSDATFATNPCVTGTAASVTTVSSTVLSPTSVTLNGNITATGGVGLSVLWRGFQYWPTSGGLTLDNLTAGTFGTGPYSSTLTGLSCGTNYSYKAFTANTVYFGAGGTLTFTTLPCPPGIPTVTTLSATAIGTTIATINGRVDATGGATVTSTGFAGSFGPTITTPASITTVPTSFSKNLTGLICGTTYTFSAKATNSAGTGSGATLSFSTLACPVTAPSVTTDPATGITAVFAVLHGTLTSTGGVTPITEGFNYGITTAYGSTYTVASATTVGSFSGGPSTPLVCGTLYHFRAWVTTTAGTAYGSDQTFTTLACPVLLPTVTTDPATAVTVSSGTLWGTITGGGTATARGFEFGPTTAYGSVGTSTGTFGPGAFNANQTGLACNTTYHYRAFATNSAGTAYGIDRTFMTLVCPITIVPPTVTTTTAIPVGTTTATLNGAITATGGANATVVGFNWSTTMTSPTTGGPFVSTTVGGPFGVGPFSLPISGLTCGGVTYHYRAWATNSAGTNYGSDMTFTTLPCPTTPPTVLTVSSIGITDTTAILTGSLTNLGGAPSATVGFEYGTTTAYGSAASYGSLTGTFGYTKNITGLICNTLYHYRATAVTTAGSATGADMTFTTNPCVIIAVPPTVVTVSATAITTTGVTMNGNLTSTGGSGVSNTVGFWWDLTTATGFSNTAPGGTMTTTGPFNSVVTGLTCNTSYHFMAFAVNSAGTVYDADISFTTLACPITVVPPTVVTTAPSSVGITTGTFNGNLTNLGGASSATISFEYGTTTAYGSTTSTSTMSSTGTFSKSLTGLICNTTYHYQAKATNTAGSAVGGDRTLTTLACPVTPTIPTVATTPASSIGVTAATLNGNLMSLGGAANATAAFEYGTTTSYGTVVTATTPTQPMTATGLFAKPITGLACNTTYHFRAKATNTVGTANGLDFTFTTLACPPGIPMVTTNSATTITATSATVGGTITNTGGATVTTEGITGTVPAWSVTGLSVTTVPTSFTHNYTGLSCGTTYTYKASATNSAGTGYGGVLSFTTTACPPTVSTTSGLLISPYIPATGSSPATIGTANLVGNLISFGLGNTSAVVGFEYGPTSSYGFTATATGYGTSLGSFNANVPINLEFTCNNPWHFRATATNAGGTAFGIDKTFCNI